METRNRQMKLEGKITISRPSYGSGKQAINIEIQDEISGIRFAEIEMTLEDFTKAITGLGCCPMTMEVRGLQYVGKKLVREKREIAAPDLGYDKSAYEKWLDENAQEEGWILETYLGSQSSITHTDQGVTLRYCVRKYVDP